jgi:uncharacterized protein (TIGR03437 family)
MLSLSPTAIALSGTNLLQTQQAISVTTGSGVIHFTDTVAVTNGSNWLTLSAASGDTPTTITANISATGLAPGTYKGTITFTPASSSAGPPQDVTVTLTVTAAPALTVSSNALSFTAQQGGAAPATQTLNVGSTVPGLAFNIATNSSTSNWLTASQVLGTTPAVLTIAANTSGLTAGSYTGSIVISSTDVTIAPVTVPVALSVTPAAPAIGAVTNAASFETGKVSPGEFVTIFGTGLGPATLAVFTPPAAGGTIDTSLSDTTVLFDGIPAPLVYTSATQLTAIVPYEVATKTDTQIVVKYQSLSSAPVTVPVKPAAPGIFVADTSGQVAALNQDTTYNGAGNGAAPGTIVSLYATGEGLVDPLPKNGAITGLPLPVLKLPINVVIGGKPAEVKYAGPAPGLPAGALQVNVLIAPDVARGSKATVVLIIGDAASQPGVFLTIAP